ncbi:MAG: hypothetical protein A6F72_08385 [Cycloclasticus sp. symbiont of Poecilosclerida sp. N]|nr:MAG: hypothetical protein A6F72_08385 [Cycloclasticus sp. symbiont of Poecilosclerida sp. N]
MKRGWVRGVFIMCVMSTFLLLPACGSPLPRTEDITKSPWNSFKEVMAAYDKVILNETTIGELRELGFDPYSTPNVKILSYLDIIQKFMPTNSVKLEHLPLSIRDCLAQQMTCSAYEAHPGIIKRKRVGGAFKDLLGFKRKTLESGWRFNALIVLNNGVAVYKVWSGMPFIDSEKSRKNPLGPLQSSGNSLAKDALGV